MVQIFLRSISESPAEKLELVMSLGRSIPEEEKVEFHVDSFVLDKCLKRYVNEAETQSGGLGGFQLHFFPDKS